MTFAVTPCLIRFSRNPSCLNTVQCIILTKTFQLNTYFSHLNLCRFKEHVQSNHPKHFLSEEEFVQLRLELSKASLAAMVSEHDETPVAQEELPPGTEDLSDPAKVQIQFLLLQETHFSTKCLQALPGACLFFTERRLVLV